ncbi:MAG TPA: hypothetical protein VL688_10055 [Verrucomicrobiae bacterium]|jgi:hypothetical protein|nr:hypothetical protein [Verrucomicrobiae bacterium]
MKRSFSISSRALVIFALLSGALIPLAYAFHGWERPAQPSQPSQLQDVIPHPVDPAGLILASKHEILTGGRSGKWESLWDRRYSDTFHSVLSFETLPEFIFALSDRRILCGRVSDRDGAEIFRADPSRNEQVLSFAVLPEDPDYWLAGTSRGLFESDDRGRTWSRFPGFPISGEDASVAVLKFYGDRLFVATSRKLMISRDLKRFEPLLTLGASRDDQEAFSIEDEKTSQFQGRIHALVPSSTAPGLLWLGTSAGVLESRDYGVSWKPLPSSGLKSRDIRKLLVLPKSGSLAASSSDGIYLYDFAQARWKELFGGLSAAPRALSLAGEDHNSLAVISDDGFAFYPLGGEVQPPPPLSIPSPEKLELFHRLLKLEPSARDIQSAVVRYSNTGSQKTKRWQWESRLKALVPQFSVGKNYSRGNSVDIDRGSTTDADRYILGPDNLDRDIDVDVSWDLKDFIWSSDQTSIDSREKLMIELRHDMVSEATRLYHERRRLQMEIFFTPASGEMDHVLRQVRLDEITALLDGMTGGYLSQALDRLYDENPAFMRLWEYEGPASPAALSAAPASA